MAVIRDVMPVFELYQPGTDRRCAPAARPARRRRAGARGRPRQHGLAEGSPQASRGSSSISSQIKELHGHQRSQRRPRDRRDDDAHRGGASIRSCARSSAILMQAAELVASPQIRNQGTIGGNVSQDTRCWYYRGGWNCYRAGGNICYADTPTAINREHAIFDADRCVAVNPSDTAPALRRARRADGHPRAEAASGSSTPRTTGSAPASTSRG